MSAWHAPVADWHTPAPELGPDQSQKPSELLEPQSTVTWPANDPDGTRGTQPPQGFIAHSPVTDIQLVTKLEPSPKPTTPDVHDSKDTGVAATKTQPAFLASIILAALGPKPNPTLPSPTVLNGVTLAADASKAVISGTTYTFKYLVAPSAVVVGDKSITLGPSGISGLATPTTTTYQGLTFAVDSSKIVIGGETHAFPSIPSPLVIGKATLTLGPSGLQGTPVPATINDLIFATDASHAYISGSTYPYGSKPHVITLGSTVVTLGPAGVSGLSSHSPTPVTLGGLSFTADASKAVISGTTYPLGPSPATVVIGGATLTLGPSGISGLSTPTPVTYNGLNFLADASEAIIGGTTHTFGSSATILSLGNTPLTIGPSGISGLSIPTAVVYDGLTFSTDASEAIISGTTYSFAASPTTLIIGGASLTIGISGISGLTTPSLTPITVNGLKFLADSSEAVISGTTYGIGKGAHQPTTLTVGSQTLTLGPSGIQGPPTLSTTIIQGVTFSVDASEAVISGTTYSIGKGAPATTVLIGNESISLGPGGVGFPSTTAVPPTASATGFDYFTGAASLNLWSSNVVWEALLLGILVLVWAL